MNNQPPKYDKRANVDAASLTVSKVVRDISEPVIVRRDTPSGRVVIKSPQQNPVTIRR